MKQVRLLVLILLTIVGAVAAAVTPPTDLSLRGIVEWVGVGGHIASGTTNPVFIQPVGTRFTNLSNPSKPVEYRHDGSAWRALWTWNHSLLSNLDYAVSGHGVVPVSKGGMGATNTVDARTNLDVFSTASTTALIDDLSGVTEIASARENIGVYSTEETNQLIAQTVALLRYYVSSEPADLPGFGSLNSVASTTESSFTAPALTTTMTQVTQRITAAGQPNISQTVAGIYPFSVNLQRSGGKLAYFQVALFKRDTGGSETHIASSSVYTLTDDLRKTVVLNLTAPETVAWASTDRLVLRSYAAKESTGVAVNIMFYYGDGNQSYITLSAGGGGVYARQDLHNVDPLTGRLALGFPSSVGKANYVLAVGTDTTTLYWSPPGGGGVSDHSLLTNLDYTLSGHTGFAASTDLPNNASFTLAGLGEKSYWSLSDLPTFGTMASETATNYVATGTFTGHTDATAAHGVGEIAGIDDIPLNASFSFDLLSDSPDYTGNGGKVLALNAEGTALQWTTVAGVGSLDHAALSHLDYESSGHTGFTGATETASITSTLQAVIASVSAELDPMNYQENYDVMASTSALVVPLSGRTYVGIQNIDDVKNIHIYPNGLVASSGPANLILYAGETWYQRLTDAVPVAFYASEATPIVIFQGK
jgi:hypothetical protein